MGKAVIVSGGKGGQYDVELIYTLDRIQATLVKLKKFISDTVLEIARREAAENKEGVPRLKLQVEAAQKQVTTLEAIPATRRVTGIASKVVTCFWAAST